MSSKSSGGKLEGFFTGKGFYIVLFLCAAVIGVSAWMLATGNETMNSDPIKNTDISLSDQQVKPVIAPEEYEKVLPSIKEKTVEPEAPEVEDEGLADTAAEEPETVQVAAVEESPAVQAVLPLYVWPVIGEIERSHNIHELSYDVTMRDWRTHSGIDIMAPLGEVVCAAHAGRVESIVQDSLYGTVLTVDHGDGAKSIYANLAELPAVSVGDWVEPGNVIGSVGTTAIGEIGQGTHLHFAMSVNGESVDPLNYLPG